MDLLNNPPLIAALLIFVSMLLFMAGAYFYSRARRNRLKLIQKIKASSAHEESAAGEIDAAPVLPEAFLARVLAQLGKPFQPQKAKEFRRKNLAFIRAGIRSGSALPIFWGAKCILALSCAALFLLVNPFLMNRLIGTNLLFVSLFAALVGYYAPDFWLRAKISERMRRIQDGLPDALDLLVVCVEAGMSLDAAAHRVAEEIRFQHKELSDELNLTNLEIRAGKLRRDALRNLGQRTNLEEINSLASLLIQTDQLGTSIAQALRIYSDSFRTQRMQKAEEIAAKLPVKLIVPLGLCILPCILIVVVGPAVIQLIRALTLLTR